MKLPACRDAVRRGSNNLNYGSPAALLLLLALEQKRLTENTDTFGFTAWCLEYQLLILQLKVIALPSPPQPLKELLLGETKLTETVSTHGKQKQMKMTPVYQHPLLQAGIPRFMNHYLRILPEVNKNG